ncbi:ankyrin repeat family protein [Flamingopox virus FGPVKD09]|uniref:Ankyrin repeat family protein n=1 Tax=Flamingopox virus FGPVKD09 TaxID=2059380 RepID=A0A2H4X215_9POXV|nr:ankyrin repeat family protein [Flamingopox virus FGPVKD09]AUD40109.1 ankyrin repeat family protein [Flamingopox virus FGPVKD09]
MKSYELYRIMCTKSDEEIINAIKEYDIPEEENTTYGSIVLHPFHQAIQIGKVALVDILSKDKNSLSLIDRYGYHPLHTACSKPRVNSILLDLLLYNRITGVDKLKHKLRNLTRAECIYIIRELASGNPIKDVSILLPEVKKIMEDEVRIVKMLLDKDADINCVDAYKEKPLHNAIKSCNVEIVKLLLDYGANPNEITLNGYTILDHAILYGNKEIFKLLIDKCDDTTKQRTSYINAFIYQKVEISECILDLESKIITDNKYILENIFTRSYYDHPLHYACYNISFKRIIKRLIDNCSNINTKNRNGNTPLHIICKSDYEICYVKMIIDSGADINSRNICGITPLYNATESKSFEKVSLLLSLGADTNIEDCCGKTPLYIASKYGDTSIVSILIDHGANVNHADFYGNSVLQAAFNNSNSLDIATKLLEKGANVNSVNSLSLTLLYRACINSKESIENRLKTIKLLIDYGAEINYYSSNNSCLLCRVNDIPQVVELLLENGLDANKLYNTSMGITAVLNHNIFDNLNSIHYVIVHIALQSYTNPCITKNPGFINNLEGIEKSSIKKEIWLKCENELRTIFNTRINKSYYLSIFLTSNNVRLLSRLVNNTLLNELDFSHFNIYGLRLKKSIEIARNRSELVYNSKEKLDSLSSSDSEWNLLPTEIKLSILDLLSDKDLYSLINL